MGGCAETETSGRFHGGWCAARCACPVPAHPQGVRGDDGGYEPGERYASGASRLQHLSQRLITWRRRYVAERYQFRGMSRA